MNFYATDFNRSVCICIEISPIFLISLPLIIHVTFHFAKVISQLTVLINDDAPLKNAAAAADPSMQEFIKILKSFWTFPETRINEMMAQR